MTGTDGGNMRLRLRDGRKKGERVGIKKRMLMMVRE